MSAREAGERVSARGVVSLRPRLVLLVLLAHQADAHRPPTSQYELQAAGQLDIERVPTACKGNVVVDEKAALKEAQKCDSISGSLAIMYGASGLFAKGKIELKKLKVVGGHLMSLKDLHNKMFFYYIRNTAMLKRHLRQKEGADLPGDKYTFATLDYLYDMYDHVFETLRKETHTTLRFTGKAITPPEHRPKGLDEAIASVLQDIRRVHGQLGQALGSAAMKARAARGAEADRPRQFYYDFATLDYLYRVFDDLDKGMRAHSLLEMQDFEPALLSSPGQLRYFIRRR